MTNAESIEKKSENKEFSSRQEFYQRFNSFIETLTIAEESFSQTPESFQRFIEGAKHEILKKELHPAESELFMRTINLYSLKNTLYPYNLLPETTEFLLSNQGKAEFTIEIGGPVGVGKTELAKALEEQIKGVKMKEEKYKPYDNVFLEIAYKDPGFMLRSQLYFLLNNIHEVVDGKIDEGRLAKDTAVVSDINVFMEKYKREGAVTEEEHEVYMKTVELFESLIKKSDLLIFLIPDSVEKLYEGIQRRRNDNPEERGMESAITMEDLEIIVEATEDAIITIEEVYGIKIFAIEIDPIKFYEKPELRYATVYKIQERLGILKELLRENPEKVADKIVSKIFAPDTSPQVVVVHSESMFSGKTSVLNHIAEKVGPDRVAAFQPRAAIRYGPEHDKNMIDRDDRSIPAETIESNDLNDIVAYIDEYKITPREKPFIFIDEVMLFTENSAQGAVDIIEGLKERGFHIVVDGIDYTFQEEPFTFMHDLVKETTTKEDWHEEQMQTKCKYCKNSARGSRRLKPDGETIAEFDDEAFEAGDHYEPVCCEEHESCANQPEDFVRQPLPMDS